MKVLVVCSFNSGHLSPFIYEQINQLNKYGVITDYFLIRGKGVFGYSRNLPQLNQKISEFNPDIIHAHYGLSGLLANMQRKIPVVTTFHGSDINVWYIRPFSMLASLLSSHSIFISKELTSKSFIKGKHNSIIPSGLDLLTFFPYSKSLARKSLGLPDKGKFILFAGAYNNRIKNFPLARDAVKKMSNSRLLELKNFERSEVNLMLNACDAALMTSFHEGSPQFIKEAMACNRPIVSTDVGDVKRVIGQTKGCFIAEPDIQDISTKLLKAVEYENTENGRDRIIELEMDIESVATKILRVYHTILRFESTPKSHF